ncbi:MAG: PepSY domain-containing protein [Akkermansiaceae bacterium]|nr:PepSY domain-containing protein [Akkermansiaceae bacterium]MCP5542513.1 PepSY domain-containing protein [Akkermansiaceae bacterium]MCP5545952.1 PepSY domain-containing protein [Akkermansiaceae bacterium]
MAESPPPPAPKKRRSRPWHRVLGVLTVLPLAWVTVTGVALNHTVDWRLDRIQIDHPWVLRAYGMTPSGTPSVLRGAPREVAAWDGQVFLDGEPAETSGALVGAVPDGDGVAIVTTSEVVRLDAAGAVVETLDSISLPELPLTGATIANDSVFLRNASGWYKVSADWLGFTPADAGDLTAQKLSPLEDKPTADRLRKSWARGGLPASRVVLDLHAGRFLGPLAAYFYDFVAVCTLWLCGTGLVLFFRKPRRNR